LLRRGVTSHEEDRVRLDSTRLDAAEREPEKDETKISRRDAAAEIPEPAESARRKVRPNKAAIYLAISEQ
jgi:hypothetical protein